MKKLMCTLLTLILIFSLAACDGKNNLLSGSNQNKISDELTGTWYGPDNDPVLNINSDGSGSVTYKSTDYDAQFTADNGLFLASSTGFALSGDYKLENEQLYVSADYDGNEYTVVFTRYQFIVPEDMKGNHAYNVGDKAYEIVVDETIICKGIPFPPSDNYPEQEIYLVPETNSEDGTTEGNTPNNDTDFKIFPKPPKDIYQPKTLNNTKNTDNTYNTANSSVSETKEQTTTEAKPDNKDYKDNNSNYIPEKISKKNNGISVTLNGEVKETSKGNSSIVGTWTSAKQEGTAYIFGYQGDVSYTVTFTFNADGTGTVTAMIFPGTLTWSLNGHRLDMTISMLGDTESGTAYVSVIGDVMYLVNLKDELHTLSRVG